MRKGGESNGKASSSRCGLLYARSGGSNRSEIRNGGDDRDGERAVGRRAKRGMVSRTGVILRPSGDGLGSDENEGLQSQDY